MGFDDRAYVIDFTGDRLCTSTGNGNSVKPLLDILAGGGFIPISETFFYKP